MPGFTLAGAYAAGRQGRVLPSRGGTAGSGGCCGDRAVAGRDGCPSCACGRGIVGGSTPVVSFGDPLRAEVATLDTETYPKAEFTVRFADDQDLNWEVGPDLRPRKHTVRDW